VQAQDVRARRFPVEVHHQRDVIDTEADDLPVAVLGFRFLADRGGHPVPAGGEGHAPGHRAGLEGQQNGHVPGYGLHGVGHGCETVNRDRLARAQAEAGIAPDARFPSAQLHGHLAHQGVDVLPQGQPRAERYPDRPAAAGRFPQFDAEACIGTGKLVEAFCDVVGAFLAERPVGEAGGDDRAAVDGGDGPAVAPGASRALVLA
jgi:hypothetical protein